MRDGSERLREEQALLEEEQRQATGKALKASSVKGSPFNTELTARLNGLDPQSPYVTQRPQRSYFWYSTGEGEIERRDPGNEVRKARAPRTPGPCRASDV